MSAPGVTRPEPSPCGFGVPRSQCHVGCGYNCRRLTSAPLPLPLPLPSSTACCGGCNLPPGHEPCGGSGSLSA